MNLYFGLIYALLDGSGIRTCIVDALYLIEVEKSAKWHSDNWGSVGTVGLHNILFAHLAKPLK